MASITSVLPSELLDRIFIYVSTSRDDIAACRLVSQAFKHLSSPYLITRVVFAKRLETTNHLREVATPHTSVDMLRSSCGMQAHIRYLSPWI